MKRVWVGGALCALVSACSVAVPDSGAVIQTVTPTTSAVTEPFEAPTTVTIGPLDATGNANAPLPAVVTAAVNGTSVETQAQSTAAAANSGVAPVQADPANPAPLQLDNPGISSEQDFDSVSAQRTIQSDASRIAANRAQYQVITPTALPTRPETGQPNIVAYALQTDNPVGAPLYRRTNLRSAQRHAAACAAFPSADQAQIEFLSRGGPSRDRKGLDPDGDGYACSWDPSPFRNARAPATPAATDGPTDPATRAATSLTSAPATNVVPPRAISSE